jgi:predicted ATP-grasp superfamily ATP-dependent carboligase
MGDWDLVRALGLAGIRSTVVATRDEPTWFSRFTCARIERSDYWSDGDAQVARLLAFATTQPRPPVLVYGGDAEMLMVSRHRDALGSAFRFVIPEAALVETLADKARFRRLAEQLGLPVAPARILRPAQDGWSDPGLGYPLLVKPLTRHEELWSPVGGHAKALRVDDAEELQRLWPRLAARDLQVIAEELIPGPESRIESFHVYVDAAGEIAGEFTGRKVRTLPAEYGHSTALVTTAAEDVAELGRDIVRRVELHGLAKLDFKRTPSGDLRLLEINPRFSLWHHLGAKAGVNLAALAYADLAGLPRPPARRARAGVRWSAPWLDRRAAREAGLPAARWLIWTARAEARSVAAWDDPMPTIRGPLRRWLTGRLASVGSARPNR